MFIAVVKCTFKAEAAAHRGWVIIYSVPIDYDEQKERKVYSSYNTVLLGYLTQYTEESPFRLSR